MSNSSQLGTKIRKGSAWLLAGNTGSQLLKFLAGIVLARILVPEDFGMVATIQIFTGLAGFVAGSGMGQALVRAKEVTAKDYEAVFTLQSIICCTIYAGFYFSAPWFAKWYDTPQYASLLRVAALSFVVRPFVSLPSSILTRNMRFKEQSRTRIIVLLFSSAVSIGMAIAGYGVWSLITGGIAGSITSALLLMPLTAWRPAIRLNLRRGAAIARYGVLVSATDILNYIQTQVSVFMLSHALGPASVGLYNKGESLARMPHSFVTGSVYQAVFRAMASQQDNLDTCRYLFFRSLGLVAVYTTPFYIGLLWLSEPLVRGVYGPNWVGAATPLFVLSFAWPFWLIANLSGAVLAAKNWLGREIPVQIYTLIVTFFAVSIGLKYGIKGVAIAIVSVAIYNALHMYTLAIRCLRANWLFGLRTFTPAVLLNVIFAGVLFIFSYAAPPRLLANDLAYVAIMGILGVMVYGLLFLYLPIPSLQSERQRWKVKLGLPHKTLS